MSHWTLLKVTTRVSLDKKFNFSMGKFLHAEKESCLTELRFTKEEYTGSKQDLIGCVYHISIRASLQDKSVIDFIDSFLEQSPYHFIEVVSGVYEKRLKHSK